MVIAETRTRADISATPLAMPWIWPAAIAECLDVIYDELNDPGYRAHEAEYLLALCSIWTRVGQLIGPSRAFGAELSSTHLDLAQLTRLAAHLHR